MYRSQLTRATTDSGKALASIGHGSRISLQISFEDPLNLGVTVTETLEKSMGVVPLDAASDPHAVLRLMIPPLR